MSEELKTQIGKRLRRIRRMRDLTQKELAKKIVGKVDYTYIGKIERGEQLPSLKILGKLSDALAAPLAFFFQEEVLSHLLPEELRKLSGEAERTALLREVAKISRGDIPLLLEIIRVLNVHRRMTGGKRKAVQYSVERKELQRAAERVGQYGIKGAGSPAGVLQEVIEKPERLTHRKPKGLGHDLSTSRAGTGAGLPRDEARRDRLRVKRVKSSLHQIAFPHPSPSLASRR